MNLNTAIKRATQHLLDSDEARTYKTKPDVWGEQSSYVLELERSEDDRNFLDVTTWGFDYEAILVPTTRQDLIKNKMFAQMRKCETPYDGLNQVALRYYLDILHRESNG